LLKRDDVDRFALVIHRSERAENRLVPQIVKGFLGAFQLLDTFSHAIVWRQQNAPEDSLLGFRRMRRQPVHLPKVSGAFDPAGSFQIRGSANILCDGVDHGVITYRNSHAGANQC